MIELLVIADDFTGALDTGVQLSKQGIPVLVTTVTNGFFAEASSDIEVLVLDIESRHVIAEDAAQIVFRVAREAINVGIKRIYKKTDSTLRGNIGAELMALLDASGGNQLAFIPAFPKGHRTTVNGIQYLKSVEINQTVFAQDLFDPVIHSSVADTIKQQSTVATDTITKDRYGEAGKLYPEKTICIFDAETDDDLIQLGYALRDADRLRFIAGCAGFAGILPQVLELKNKELKWKNCSKNILIVSGSVNPISMEQLEYAKKIGYQALTLSPESKLVQNYIETENGQAFINNAVDLMNTGKRVIIEAVCSSDQISQTEKYAIDEGYALQDIHIQIARNIGEIVKQILSKTEIENLVVFGGDTLYGIMEKIDCDRIFPIMEVASGIAAAIAVTPKKSIRLITKAGGLGGREIISRIESFIMIDKEVL